MRDEELLNGWIPYRMIPQADGTVRFRWLFIGTHDFAEPFFEESVSACLSLPENRAGAFPVTTGEQLLRVAAMAECISPTAFVYHISRCGSTLVSQLLACDPKNIVLSEVPLLDEILRMKITGSETPRRDVFLSVVKLLCRKRTGDEERVFIKTDSWHILYYAKLCAWYPDSISFLLFRDPPEVGASQSKMPAMHSVPGVIDPALFGLTESEAAEMTRDTYLDHVLACYLSAYCGIMQSGSTASALNYHEGVMNMLTTIASRCGCRFTPDVMTAMEERMKFHSKKPERNFHGDESAPVSGKFIVSRRKFLELLELTHSQKTPAHGT